MSTMQATTSRFSSPLRYALAVAACAVSFGVMGVSSAEAAPRHTETRCIAQAKTITGAWVRGTRAAETRRNARQACRVALRQCDDHINRRRNPLAQCQVVRRERIRHEARVEHRCVAKAFTRGGRELSNTRAVETRPRKRAACNVAVNKCERKLDRKRYQTGRNLPHARCEVVRTQRIVENASRRGNDNNIVVWFKHQ